MSAQCEKVSGSEVISLANRRFSRSAESWIGRQRVLDLVRDAPGHIGPGGLALGGLQFGDVVEGDDEAVGPAAA